MLQLPGQQFRLVGVGREMDEFILEYSRKSQGVLERTWVYSRWVLFVERETV